MKLVNLIKNKSLLQLLTLLTIDNLYRKKFEIKFISTLIGCYKNDSSLYKKIPKILYLIFSVSNLDKSYNYSINLINLIIKVMILITAKDQLYFENKIYKKFHRYSIISNFIFIYLELFIKNSKIKFIWPISSIIFLVFFNFKKNNRFIIPKSFLILWQYTLFISYEISNK